MPTEITIPRSVVEQFVKLAEAIEAADGIYKSCQHALFRSFVVDACKARNCQEALTTARKALEETPTSP